jgi:hypothetical protein
MRVRVVLAWYDMWIGAYWDRKQKVLYLFPLPMIGLAVHVNGQPPNPEL